MYTEKEIYKWHQGDIRKQRIEESVLIVNFGSLLSPKLCRQGTAVSKYK